MRLHHRVKTRAVVAIVSIGIVVLAVLQCYRWVGDGVELDTRAAARGGSVGAVVEVGSVDGVATKDNVDRIAVATNHEIDSVQVVVRSLTGEAISGCDVLLCDSSGTDSGRPGQAEGLLYRSRTSRSIHCMTGNLAASAVSPERPLAVGITDASGKSALQVPSGLTSGVVLCKLNKCWLSKPWDVGTKVVYFTEISTCQVSGRFVLSDGTACTGLQALVAAQDPSSGEAWLGSCGVDGAFECWVPNGRQVLVRVLGCMPWCNAMPMELLECGEGHKVNLERCRSIRVIDRSGKPITSVDIAFLDASARAVISRRSSHAPDGIHRIDRFDVRPQVLAMARTLLVRSDGFRSSSSSLGHVPEELTMDRGSDPTLEVAGDEHDVLEIGFGDGSHPAQGGNGFLRAVLRDGDTAKVLVPQGLLINVDISRNGECVFRDVFEMVTDRSISVSAASVGSVLATAPGQWAEEVVIQSQDWRLRAEPLKDGGWRSSGLPPGKYRIFGVPRQDFVDAFQGGASFAEEAIVEAGRATHVVLRSPPKIPDIVVIKDVGGGSAGGLSLVDCSGQILQCDASGRLMLAELKKAELPFRVRSMDGVMLAVVMDSDRWSLGGTASSGRVDLRWLEAMAKVEVRVTRAGESIKWRSLSCSSGRRFGKLALARAEHDSDNVWWPTLSGPLSVGVSLESGDLVHWDNIVPDGDRVVLTQPDKISTSSRPASTLKVFVPQRSPNIVETLDINAFSVIDGYAVRLPRHNRVTTLSGWHDFDLPEGRARVIVTSRRDGMTARWDGAISGGINEVFVAW